ncbi:MAG: hypothetical protein B9J98_03665 [Candidatus Terraquivivens tikiterensis]|uniref:Uncharacterized protein n=1 Tax=Candidatus Terraquivivens tikiterensis TaxID=1980982 RepID=A0A2R7Y5D1_9ARCH|nr:MAG: hypothetical protein B9J98_03665 [Candidatus Terraquivivens tikiterensis]
MLSNAGRSYVAWMSKGPNKAPGRNGRDRFGQNVCVLNIGLARGAVNGAMARPLLLRWKGMRWEGKSSMNDQPMRALEARIPT